MRELVTIVDLFVVSPLMISKERSQHDEVISTNLDVLISHHIILESLELQMQHGWERLEYDSLLGVLQSESFSGVSILSIHRLDLDIILERILQSSQPLDIELNIYPQTCCQSRIQEIHARETYHRNPRSGPTRNRR